MFLRNTPSGGTAGLDRLELFPVHYSAADIVDDLPQRNSHRHLDKTCVDDLARKGEDLCPWRILRPDVKEPIGTFFDDRGHARISLDVVQVARVTPGTPSMFGKPRRPRSRETPFTF